MDATASAGWTALRIVTWVLRLAVAALFLFAAFMKLSGQSMMIEEFGKIGMGDWFRSATGLIEVAGAILVLIPMTTAFGALLLLCVDIGAFFAQAFILHGDVIHTFVIGVVLLVLLYLQRHQLLGRLGG